jgi:hypothetical protein
MSPIYVPGKVVLAKTYVEGDRNFSNVSLLLHGNGTNGSTTITDNSPTPKTVTAVGNAQISTAQSKFGGASIAFDGNGDYLTTSMLSGDNALGTTDFTIEFWLRLNSIPLILCSLVDYRPTSTQGAYPVLYLSNSNIRYYVSSADRIAGSNLSINVWYHVALCKASSSTRLFIDGTQVGSTYSDANNYLGSNNRPYIGAFSDTLTGPLNGYIDDLRITKGVARYTANFTPPTAAFADAQF